MSNKVGLDDYLLNHSIEDFKKLPIEEPKAKRSRHDLEIARRVVHAYKKENILFTNDFFWKWNQAGLWVKMDDREVKQKIHSLTEVFSITKNLVGSILDLIKTEVFKPNHQFDINTKTINCLNGELYWNGNDWELQYHCREHYRTTQIPVNYDHKSRAPRFEQFLDEIFVEDQDKDEKKILVCEFIGYTLLSSCEYEKFILLIGPGANGKSVLMDTVAALVGPENVSAVQPNQFENRFQRAHLHCKLLNLVTEIAEGHEIADAQLKAIASGELTTAEHKFKGPFEFRPFATCWFGTNHMPHTRDFSDALFRRALILPFNKTFREHEQDKHLKEKLKNELPGIFNLAVEAIAGVFVKGDFTRPESSEQAKSEWRLECDQVEQFIKECCIIGTSFSESSADTYSAYKDWAEKVGIKRTLNHKNFTTRMIRLGVEPTKGTGGIRMLAGVSLK